MTVHLEVAEDPARACAAMMLGVGVTGGHIVLAGGSTPKRAYEELVRAARESGADLSAAQFWFGDERCVDPQDERSNYRMAREALLDPLGLAGSPAVRRMRGELGPAEGASAYARQLIEAGEPHFDLLLVGIGPDGHTLSLFPGQGTLGVRDRLVVGVPEAGLEPLVPRISFSLAAVAMARHVVVLAEGEAKAEALARAFGPDASPDPQVPSSYLPEVARELTLLFDPAAASRLQGGAVREGQ